MARRPDDPEKFDVSSRGDELTVIYLDWKDTNNKGEPKRKKAGLQTLLNRVESPGAFEPVSIISQAVDNRKLYLDTVRLFGDQLDRFAKHFPSEDKKPLRAEDEVRTLYKTAVINMRSNTMMQSTRYHECFRTWMSGD